MSVLYGFNVRRYNVLMRTLVFEFLGASNLDLLYLKTISGHERKDLRIWCKGYISAIPFSLVENFYIYLYIFCVLPICNLKTSGWFFRQPHVESSNLD